MEEGCNKLLSAAPIKRQTGKEMGNMNEEDIWKQMSGRQMEVRKEKEPRGETSAG